jgi:hypothetical protein
MRSNGPLANKEVAIGGHGWPWVARSSGAAESGRLVRRTSHRVDPAAIAEEARTVRLDAILRPGERIGGNQRRQISGCGARTAEDGQLATGPPMATFLFASGPLATH